jgi:hypothetical protein
MTISDLNYLESLLEEASFVSGGKTLVESTSVKETSGKGPNSTTTSINTTTLVSNDAKGAAKAEQLLASLALF